MPVLSKARDRSDALISKDQAYNFARILKEKILVAICLQIESLLHHVTMPFFNGHKHPSAYGTTDFKTNFPSLSNLLKVTKNTTSKFCQMEQLLGCSIADCLVIILTGDPSFDLPLTHFSLEVSMGVNLATPHHKAKSRTHYITNRNYFVSFCSTCSHSCFFWASCSS